jgi:hypothetical protein
MNCGARRNSGCRTTLAASSASRGSRSSASSRRATGSTLEVEPAARGLLSLAGAERRCQGATGGAGARPVARRARDHLMWRKRRYRCRECGRSFTESHPELPARQRVTRPLPSPPAGAGAWRRSARRGGARGADEPLPRRPGFRAGADDELDARRGACPARRPSMDEAHPRRGQELATVVSDLDPRRIVEVLDGRSRRRVERYLRSLPERQRVAIEVFSIEPYEASRQAIRAELPGRGSWSTTSTSCAAPTQRSPRSGPSASARPGGASPKVGGDQADAGGRGLEIRQIVRRTGHDRNTVRRSGPPRYERPARRSKIDLSRRHPSAARRPRRDPWQAGPRDPRDARLRRREDDPTNGKAERFIGTLLAGWAYAAVYGSSAERADAASGWLKFYNSRRRHGSLGHRAPMERLNASQRGTNLLGSSS